MFIEIRPSLRDNKSQPIVTEESVKVPFDAFFAKCEVELNKSVLSQWPRSWSDFPPAWVNTQISLLHRYDQDPVIVNKLLPIVLAQRAAGAWPQYYIGATPLLFPPAALRAAAVDAAGSPAWEHGGDDVDGLDGESASLANGAGAGDPLVSRAQAWLDHD